MNKGSKEISIYPKDEIRLSLHKDCRSLRQDLLLLTATEAQPINRSGSFDNKFLAWFHFQICKLKVNVV